MDLSDAAGRQRIVVAISGASGACYGVRLLEALRGAPGFESHLVVSPAGWRNLGHELAMTPADLRPLADHVHDVDDVGATIASGSFRAAGMAVAPCSMRTLAAIANGMGDNLITRAADVMLKERRRLVLMVREAPLHLGHLRNMVAVTEMGGVVFPPLPAFYHRPGSIDELVDESVERALKLCGIEAAQPRAWSGL